MITEHQCYGCTLSGWSDRTPFPPKWRRIKLFGTAQLFCENCLPHFNFNIGQSHPSDISPHMKNLLLKQGKYGS